MSTLTKLILLLLLAVLLVWNGRAMAQDASVKAGISARLRAEPSRGGAVVGQLRGGTEVEVVEAKGDFVRVFVAGKDGWVARRLLNMKAAPKAVAVSRAAPVPASAPAPAPAPEARPQESQPRYVELALIREEQEKNTWRMLATLAGVAVAAFIGGFWLRGTIFRQRYGWLDESGRYRAAARRRPE